ncbi:hypothetical protein D3C74_212380 [compost metagenome]
METIIYNGSEIKITIVSDGNKDVVIPSGEFAKIELDLLSRDNPDGIHKFNDDSFYVQGEGDWIEIYNSK